MNSLILNSASSTSPLGGSGTYRRACQTPTGVRKTKDKEKTLKKTMSLVNIHEKKQNTVFSYDKNFDKVSDFETKDSDGVYLTTSV